MPKPTKGPRLGGGPAHERLLLANLAAALFTHKSITDDRDQGQAPASARRASRSRSPSAATCTRVVACCRVIGDKERRARALHRDRAAGRRARGWLHPHHEDRQPQGRQRPHGRHRARPRAGDPEAEVGQEDRRCRCRVEEAPAEAPADEAAADEAEVVEASADEAEVVEADAAGETVEADKA